MLGDNMKCKIGDLIDEKGLRRKFIANKMGITPQQLSNWIHERNYPTIDKAFKIADLLGCKVDDLYERVENMKDPGNEA